MGNILQDSWTSIWDGGYAKSIRDGKFIPENCNKCEFMPTCNGACHLSRPSAEIRST
jgi:radical SAM protein with 4Fe4S-binding SPASM domain